MPDFLSHYYEGEDGPFSNLSMLPPEQAEQILGEIRRNGKRFASHRPSDYLKKRLELEIRIRLRFEEKGGKDGISFKGQRRNFAVARPKSRWLDGVLVLQRPLQDPRIHAAQPYSKRLFGNHFRVTMPVQLGDEFAKWVCAAYQVGEG